MSRSALTDSDIVVLMRGASDEERAAAAHKICRRVEVSLGEDEREAAEEVLRMMARDAAELVRRALAVTLRTSKALPRDVALTLARDVDSVAAPVLRFSPAFTDEDLAGIVQVCAPIKQIAVARRATLSDTVTSALVRHGGEQAVRVACANDAAEFSERTLAVAMERFADNETVAMAIAYRKALPPAISEKLVSLVSDGVRQRLMDRHALSAEAAMGIALGARERATVDLVDQAGRASDLKAFTAHLHRHERLTPSLLLRALAHGHVSFFEWGVAELAGVAHSRAWVLVHDAGALGLRAICERAGLPMALFPVFRAAMDTYHALQAEGGDLEVEVFQQRMLERFLTQDSGADTSDIDYLLERMDRRDAAEPMQAAVAEAA